MTRPLLTLEQARHMMAAYPGHLIRQVVAAGRAQPPTLSRLQAALKAAPNPSGIHTLYRLAALKQIKRTEAALAARAGRS